MYRKSCIPLVVIIIIITVFSVGCKGNNIKNSNINKIAYVSINTASEYKNTFDKLQLGTIFDFNLKLLQADKSWVRIWVEGYSNGKAIKSSPLLELSYGLYPSKVSDGLMGFGILNPNGDEPQFFLYSEGVKTGPNNSDSSFFIKSASSCWNYAIGNGEIGLDSGKEVILAVYRQAKDSFKSGYEYQNPASVDEMIKDDLTVLILKIKVEEKR